MMSACDQICAYYSLGSPINIQQISGGLLHTLWQVTTKSGRYAIKLLNPDNSKLMHNLLDPQTSQKVAAFMQANEVATITSLKKNDEYFCKFNGATFLVMPWIDGQYRSVADLIPAEIRLIGKMLAKIHEANYCSTSLSLPKWIGLNTERWLQLCHEIADKEFSTALLQHLPTLISWSKAAKSASPDLTRDVIFSHRDLTPRNVLWNDNNPILLDWEYAGLINRTLDVFIVACNWSGVLRGEWCLQNFLAVIEGYEEQMATKITLNKLILDGYYGYCLDWLIYNARKLASSNTINLETTSSKELPSSSEEVSLSSQKVSYREDVFSSSEKVFSSDNLAPPSSSRNPEASSSSRNSEVSSSSRDLIAGSTKTQDEQICKHEIMKTINAIKIVEKNLQIR